MNKGSAFWCAWGATLCLAVGLAACAGFKTASQTPPAPTPTPAMAMAAAYPPISLGNFYPGLPYFNGAYPFPALAVTSPSGSAGVREARPGSAVGAAVGVVPFALAGSPPQAGPGFAYLPGNSQEPGLEVLLSRISREAAGKIFYQLQAEGEGFSGGRLAVTAAVPLSDLKRESEFGRVLAEYLLTDLADRGLRVTELRLGRDIHIVPQTGEFILSRNVGELASHFQELDYVVVNTYSNTRKTLMLQGRLVELQSGKVLTSWRHYLPLNRELRGLFDEAERPYTIAVRGML